MDYRHIAGQRECFFGTNGCAVAVHLPTNGHYAVEFRGRMIRMCAGPDAVFEVRTAAAFYAGTSAAERIARNVRP